MEESEFRYTTNQDEEAKSILDIIGPNVYAAADIMRSKIISGEDVDLKDAAVFNMALKEMHASFNDFTKVQQFTTAYTEHWKKKEAEANKIRELQQGYNYTEIRLKSAVPEDMMREIEAAIGKKDLDTTEQEEIEKRELEEAEMKSFYLYELEKRASQSGGSYIIDYEKMCLVKK